MAEREILITADAPESLYDRPIALHKDTWTKHIAPFKATVTVEAIASVISDVHEAYEEQDNKNRHFLLNSTTVSRTGKPLTVVVDPLSYGQYVHVCTAFYNRQPKVGSLIWSKSDSAPTLRTSYDSDYDILYLALGSFRSQEEEPLESGVLLGFEENDREPKAATIMRFSARSKGDRRRLAERLTALLQIPAHALDNAMQLE